MISSRMFYFWSKGGTFLIIVLKIPIIVVTLFTLKDLKIVSALLG